MANLEKYLEIAVMLIGIFAAVAAITPNKADNKIAQFLLDLINKLGFNIGNAKNG